MKATATIITSLLTFSLCCPTASAEEAAARHTMQSLSENPECAIVDEGDGVYQITESITIPVSDIFSIEGAKTVKFANGATLTIEGEADFDASAAGEPVLITSIGEDTDQGGIIISCDNAECAPTTFKNIAFDSAALRSLGVVGFNIDNCSFSHADGSLSSAGAVAIGPTGGSYTIINSTFADNQVPAIGGAANYACGLTIDNCEFTNNNTTNTNKPQLNLTVGGELPVSITNCTLTGAGLDMVGAIAVGNLLAMEGENKVIIENCTITDHRYGITGIGPMSMLIRDNTLIDNNHESNPMNGGSGISLAGYGYQLDAIVSGNHIENSLWGITIIMCNDVNLGEIDNADSPGGNVFVNNGNNGVKYDLYNNQSNPVMAQNNTWNVTEQTAEQIEEVIYHAADDPSLGEVTYMPAASSTSLDAAVAAPAISIIGARLVCSEPVEVVDAAGRIAIPASANPSIANLPAGAYIARSASASFKFVRR